MIKERDYEGYKNYLCTKCQFDTFDKAEAKAHEAANQHDGPSSQPQPKVEVTG